MPREKENYRDMMERLDIAFPNTEIITLNRAIKFLGLSDDTAKKLYPFQKVGRTYYISKSKLAKEIC